MGCSTSVPDRHGRGKRPTPRRLAGRTVVCAALSAGCWIALVAADGSAWDVAPQVWLGAGYESESGVDPDRDLVVVPGGAFVNLTPSIVVARGIGARSNLAFAATGSAERIDDEEGRVLVGLSGWAELTLRGRRPLYGRLWLGADYFDDSVIETALRNAVSARGTMGWGSSRRAVEVHGGFRARRYPNLVTVDDSGVSGTYDESTAIFGVSGFTAAGRSSVLRGEISKETTDARDPAFDSGNWILRADFGRAAAGRWSTWLSLVAQRRAYENRAPGEDTADYLQAGLRAERDLGRRPRLSLQGAYVSYDDGSGSDDGLRLGAFVTFRFGAAVRAPRALPAVPETAPPVGAVEVENGLARFRFRAPAAVTVSVAGDFNGWDPEAAFMRSVGDGWWEVRLAVPPGLYQYAFVVDGVWFPPPAPAVVVDDGFGGRNGVLEVPE